MVRLMFSVDVLNKFLKWVVSFQVFFVCRSLLVLVCFW